MLITTQAGAEHFTCQSMNSQHNAAACPAELVQKVPRLLPESTGVNLQAGMMTVDAAGAFPNQPAQWHSLPCIAASAPTQRSDRTWQTSNPAFMLRSTPAGRKLTAPQSHLVELLLVLKQSLDLIPLVLNVFLEGVELFLHDPILTLQAQPYVALC